MYVYNSFNQEFELVPLASSPRLPRRTAAVHKDYDRLILHSCYRVHAVPKVDSIKPRTAYSVFAARLHSGDGLAQHDVPELLSAGRPLFIS